MITPATSSAVFAKFHSFWQWPFPKPSIVKGDQCTFPTVFVLNWMRLFTCWNSLTAINESTHHFNSARLFNFVCLFVCLARFEQIFHQQTNKQIQHHSASVVATVGHNHQGDYRTHCMMSCFVVVDMTVCFTSNKRMATSQSVSQSDHRINSEW